MGTVNIEKPKPVVNVTDILKDNKTPAYSAAQGFAVAPNGVSFAVSLNNATDKAALIGIVGSNRYIRTGVELGHGKDCTYYNGYFYVTVGGDSDDPLTVKRYKLNTSSSEKWESSGTFTYEPMSGLGLSNKYLTKVSGIVHVSKDTFILSQKRKFSVCSLDETKKQFVEFSRFEISNEDWAKLSRDDCKEPDSQGMYYANGKLYKAFSYRNKNSETTIKKNDIAEFTLQGNDATLQGKDTSFNGISLNARYSCDRTSKTRFEVEGIGSPDGGANMYMYANVREKGSDSQTDSIYRITLKN